MEDVPESPIFEYISSSLGSSHHPHPPEGSPQKGVVSADTVNKRAGRISDTCVWFEGAKACLEIPQSSVLEAAADTLKVDLWLKVAELQFGTMTVFDCQLGYVRVALKVMHGVYALLLEESAERGGCGCIASSSSSANAGEWQHVACTWQPCFLLRVNGVRQALSVEETQQPVQRSRNTRGKEVAVLGCSLPDSFRVAESDSEPFIGGVSEVRISADFGRGLEMVARYACDNIAAAGRVRNAVDRSGDADALLRNGARWRGGEVARLPPTCLELPGPSHLTGGTLGMGAHLDSFEVSGYICTRSTAAMTVFGVTDSQKHHAHVKLAVNCNKTGAHESGILHMSVGDCNGSRTVATYKRIMCDGKWYHLRWVVDGTQFSLFVNGMAVETIPATTATTHDFLKFMDYPALGGHNDRGNVTECFCGLLHDFTITENGKTLAQWRLDDGPGSTLCTDSSGEANHAVLRTARPKQAGGLISPMLSPTQRGETSTSSPRASWSRARSDYALIDRHAASWVPLPRPPAKVSASTLNAVVLPEDRHRLDRKDSGALTPSRSRSKASRASIRHSISPMAGRIEIPRPSPSPSVTVSKAFRHTIRNIAIRGGAFDAVEQALDTIQRNTNTQQTEAAVAHWACRSENNHFTTNFASPLDEPPHFEPIPPVTCMGMIDDLKTWVTPVRRMWCDDMIDRLKTNAAAAATRFKRAYTNCNEEHILPFYLLTAEMVEPLIWAVWDGSGWFLLHTWRDLEGEFKVHGCIANVPANVALEVHIRTGSAAPPKDVSIQDISDDPEILQNLAGLTLFETNDGGALMRYTHTPSFVPVDLPVVDPIAWLTSPTRLQLHPGVYVPSHILEAMFARPCQDSFVVMGFEVEGVRDQAVLSVLEACCKSRMPAKVDAAVLEKLAVVVQDGIPSLQVSAQHLFAIIRYQCLAETVDDAAMLSAECIFGLPGLTPAGIHNALSIQRVTDLASGLSFLVSLTGRQHERFLLHDGSRQSGREVIHIDMSEWSFNTLWRIANRHPSQLINEVSYTLDAASKGVDFSSIFLKGNAEKVLLEGQSRSDLEGTGRSFSIFSPSYTLPSHVGGVYGDAETGGGEFFLSPRPEEWHAKNECMVVDFRPVEETPNAEPSFLISHDAMGWCIKSDPDSAYSEYKPVLLEASQFVFELGAWLLPKARPFIDLVTTAMANLRNTTILFSNSSPSPLLSLAAPPVELYTEIPSNRVWKGQADDFLRWSDYVVACHTSDEGGMCDLSFLNLSYKGNNTRFGRTSEEKAVSYNTVLRPMLSSHCRNIARFSRFPRHPLWLFDKHSVWQIESPFLKANSRQEENKRSFPRHHADPLSSNIVHRTKPAVSSADLVLKEITELDALELQLRKCMATKNLDSVGCTMFDQSPMCQLLSPRSDIADETFSTPLEDPYDRLESNLSDGGFGGRSSSLLFERTALTRDDDLIVMEQYLRVIRRVAAAKEAQCKSSISDDPTHMEAQISEHLTWALEEVMCSDKPLVRTEWGWKTARALLRLGADRSKADKMLRRVWGESGGSRSNVDHLDRVVRLLQCGASCIANGERLVFSAPYDEEFTPIHVAAAGNRASYLPMLADLFEVNIDATDADGNTALHLAIEAIALDAATVLIDMGAATSTQNSSGRTPLHVAIFRDFALTPDSYEVLKNLAEVTDLTLQDQHHLTPADLAKERDQRVVVGVLKNLEEMGSVGR